MRQWLLVGALAVASFVSSAAVAVGKTTFPKIGGIQFGDPGNYDDPAYQAALTKLDVMVLKTHPGRSWSSEVAAIKRAHPGALVFFYVNVNERDTREQAIGGGMAPYIDKLNAMKWWLYTSKTTGSPVQSWFGPAYDAINITPYTRRDSSGLNGIEWITKFFVDNYYKATPNSDGLFVDNAFVKPNIDGDWNLDGKLDKKTDAAAATYYRQGIAAYFKKARALMPGKIQLGNIGAIGEDGTFPEYSGVIEGGMVEGLIGKSWSRETYMGWAPMMAKYRKVMNSVVGAKIVIFNQWGDPKDYQAMRYGLASCLLDNGYYNFTSTAKGYTGVVWFDEYNANLGIAESTPPTAAWKSGVYRRDFENGIALVNPKGNGPRTVTLESDFVKLRGSQAPTINSGAKVRTVTLKDRDGIILLRPSSGARPAAVSDLTVN
jgi:hypothetical protein